MSEPSHDEELAREVSRGYRSIVNDKALGLRVVAVLLAVAGLFALGGSGPTLAAASPVWAGIGALLLGTALVFLNASM